MARAKAFEELWIWQEARAFSKQVWSDFGPDTAARHDYGFRDQAWRAAISVMNNIAEGFERGTDADFARFLYIAKGSCGELRSMYAVAEDLGYVAADVCTERRDKTRQIAAGIASLIAHLKS